MATDIRVSELNLISANKDINQIIVNDFRLALGTGITKKIATSNLLTNNIVKEENIVDGAITTSKINSNSNFIFNNTTITGNIFLSENIKMRDNCTVDGHDLSKLGERINAIAAGATACTGTVTSVAANAGTGISVTGSPITGAGTLTITNASPNATHTGDVTGSAALTIANNCVSNAKLAVMSLDTIKGRITDDGDPQDLTVAQVCTLINAAPTSAVDLQAVTDNGNITTNSLSVAALSAFGKIIGGSETNTATGDGATMLGGSNNKALGTFSSVAGGSYNEASGDYSSIGGGFCNTATGSGAVVTGGACNTASGEFSTVLGGYCNRATACYSTVAGGVSGLASGDYSSIGGGFCNTATGSGAVVIGGACNTASGDFSTVLGGYCNRATACYSTVAGGVSGLASGDYSSIGGGSCNTVSGKFSNIWGGYHNIVNANYSSIIGGEKNIITSDHHNSFIIGSNITSAAACYTFVNNLSSQGAVRAQSISLNGIHICNNPGNTVTFDGNCSNIWSTTRKGPADPLIINNPGNIRTGTYILTLSTGDSGVVREVTWGSKFCFPDEVSPTLSNTNNCLDIIHLVVLKNDGLLFAVK